MLYRASGLDVDTVLIDGNVVLKDGRFAHIDAEQVATNLADAAAVKPPESHDAWATILQELRPHIVEFWRGWVAAADTPMTSVRETQFEEDET
jgi:hypothetical protein